MTRLIFDLDGTLADTAKATIPACATMSARHRLPPLEDRSVREAIGYASPEFYYHLYPQYEKSRLDAFGADVDRAEIAFIRQIGPGILFPGVPEMLMALRAMGVLLYIASTGDEAHVNAVLDGAGIERLFDGIHCGQPEKVTMVGAIVGPEDRRHWAMVGDRQKDLDAARGNGITAIAACYGYCSAAAAARFDWTLHAPNELPAWVTARRENRK